MKLFTGLKDKIGGGATGILGKLPGLIFRSVIRVKDLFVKMFRTLYDALEEAF